MDARYVRMVGTMGDSFKQQQEVAWQQLLSEDMTTFGGHTRSTNEHSRLTVILLTSPKELYAMFLRYREIQVTP